MILWSVKLYYIVYSKVCHKEDVILGLISVINTLPEKELKRELINKICQPFAQKILEDAKLIPSQENDESDSKAKRMSLSRVAKNLDKLSLIVKSLTPAEDKAQDHVIVGVLTDMWNLLETFLLRFYVVY